MYQTLNNNYLSSYDGFVKKSLERLTAHFGDYSGGGGYQLKPLKRNTDYDLFK